MGADEEGAPLPLHQILVINLEHRARRLERFLASARDHGLEGITVRFPAVDGKRLDLDSFPRGVVVDAGVWAASRPPREVRGVNLTRGALGLILSWHTLLQQIAADGSSTHVYLVCEDDATFNPRFVPRLRSSLKAADATNPDWEFLHVGYYDDDCCVKPLGGAAGGLLCRPVEVYGLFGAALRPAGARKLLEALFPLSEQIDSGLAKVYGRLHALATLPSLMHAEHSALGTTDIQIIPPAEVLPQGVQHWHPGNGPVLPACVRLPYREFFRS